jgi:peptide/nickel transport system substrate-binding protein
MQWKFFGDLFRPDWQAPEFNPAEAKRLLNEAGYKSDPIPYQVLNNYYTAQVPTAQVLVEGWRQVGLNVEIMMKENFSETVARTPNRAVRDNSNTAFFPDPAGAMEAFGPDGQQAGTGEWRNPEADQMLTVLSTNMDRDKRRAAFRRMLEICEREDPAYTVLHQTANFTAKRRDIPWRAWPTFAMDFSAKNWSR